MKPIPKRTAAVLIAVLVVDAGLILLFTWLGPPWKSFIIVPLFVLVAVMVGAILMYATLPRQRELRRARAGQSRDELDAH